MSKEVAIQFFAAVDKSPDLQREIGIGHADSPETAKQFLAVAARAGYIFSVEDLRAAVKAVAARRMETGELSEEELQKVAGGIWCAFSYCICTGCCLTL